MSSNPNKIDIIIPVYNNLKLTINCIESIYKHLILLVNKVIIHDDCSTSYTNAALSKLKITLYPNLEIIRSEQNIGFAAGVNKAAKQASAEYLFILNTDTEIRADIISPMLNILRNNTKLAAINPSGPVFKHKRLKRCIQHQTINAPKSKYINSANISGYALLINKNIFEHANGFNTIYGRGYYEDNELSRVLINQGYELAIYPTNHITHIGQSSFNKATKSINFTKDLINKNRDLYLTRHPKAQDNLDIYTLKADFNKLDSNTKQSIINTILEGGTATIHSLFPPRNLPFFQIKYKKIKLSRLIKLLLNKKL